MCSDKVSFNIFDPAPEEVDSVEMAETEKSKEVSPLLVIPHALGDKHSLVVSESTLASFFIEDTVLDQLVDLAGVSLSHQGLAVWPQPHGHIFALFFLLPEVMVKLFLDSWQVALLYD
jgi:hypothetical protein